MYSATKNMATSTCRRLFVTGSGNRIIISTGNTNMPFVSSGSAFLSIRPFVG